MAKVIGEAQLDSTGTKWFYALTLDDGRILLQSEPEFNNKLEAENELVQILRRLAARLE